MSKTLLPFQKAILYLAVLSVISYPLCLSGLSAKAYAANKKENAALAANEKKSAVSHVENHVTKKEALVLPLRIHTAPKVPFLLRTGGIAEVDALDIPAVQNARLDAQNALLAKREALDLEWLAAKQKEKKQVSPSSETPKSASLRSIGKFKLTAYCPCYQCSGGWGRMTSSGKTARAHHTVAVDPRVIPEGTKLKINGENYVAEDVGGGVKGNHIDIFYESHRDALQFGVRYAEVFIIE